MHLTPKEIDKLLLLSLGAIAERRKQKGLKLNHPEAVASGWPLLRRRRRYGIGSATYGDCLDSLHTTVRSHPRVFKWQYGKFHRKADTANTPRRY